MAYTRLNPLKDSFSYSGTATATNIIATLKNAGMLDGTWLICAIVWPTASDSTGLQCRLFGSASGLAMAKDSPAKTATIVVTTFYQDETVRLETYCPTSTAIGWKLRGVRLA